jgi:hypothetical protein
VLPLMVLPIRLCDPCQNHVDPSELKCELCANVGGAYNQTEEGQWVHSLCFLAVPELYTVKSRDGRYRVCMKRLDQQRFKLRCQLCKQYGSCIQCTYRRCAVSTHPWCLYRDMQGFKYCRDENNEVWMFCDNHAKIADETMAAISLKQKGGVDRPDRKKSTRPKATEAAIVNTDLIGQVILRDFGRHGLFMGYIRSFQAPYYLVEYPVDNDAEEMTEAQLLPLLLRSEKGLPKK